MGAPEEGKEFRYTVAGLMGIRKILEESKGLRRVKRSFGRK
ncbi:MAG: hypothetical protein QXP84_04025 [Candidatus Korarchaeum sp.]